MLILKKKIIIDAGERNLTILFSPEEIYPTRPEILPTRPEILPTRPEIYPTCPEILPTRPENITPPPHSTQLVNDTV